MKSLVPAERIERSILLIRRHRVLLDADLASMYGVSTKALNQAVTRNLGRFPDDFMFRLTRAEKKEVVTHCDHLAQLKFSASLPLAFTEEGVAMLSAVLRSRVAIEVSIQIMRAFVRLRQLIASNDQLRHKVDLIERKLADHDGHFAAVFDAIRALMSEEPTPEKSRIGFETESNKQ